MMLNNYIFASFNVSLKIIIYMERSLSDLHRLFFKSFLFICNHLNLGALWRCKTMSYELELCAFIDFLLVKTKIKSKTFQYYWLKTKLLFISQVVNCLFGYKEVLGSGAGQRQIFQSQLFYYISMILFKLKLSGSQTFITLY